MMLEPDTRQ